MNDREKEVYQAQLDAEKAVLKKLEKLYQSALDDIDEKVKILQSDELTQSKIYQVEYQKALRGQIAGIVEKLHGDEYTTIQQYLHECYTDAFVGTMYDIHGQGIPLIIPIDQNAAVKAIQLDSKINEGLYEALKVDAKALKKTIQTEVSRGIATSLGYADIARNISNASLAPRKRAMLIARTESHRITQASTFDAQKGAKKRGCDVLKQWDATMDGDTRSTHRQLDGQLREIDKPFELGNKKAMFPGDFGDPAEDCNCRCVSNTRAKWDLDEDELETLKERAEFFGLDKTEQLDEFKKTYLDAAESENAVIGADPDKITKNKIFAINSKAVDGGVLARKMDAITSEPQERREFLHAAKEILHHRSGQNGEDLYLYNRSTKKWVRSTSGTKPGTPEYTQEILDAITSAKPGEIVAFHNHPSNMPPSASDINAALGNGYSAGYVLCHDGTVYEYTAGNERIDERIYNLRIEKLLSERYNEHEAQLKTMNYLSELFGFVFKEVK